MAAKSSTNTKRKPSPFGAVTVQPSLLDCCESAAGQIDNRYLANDAPNIPLLGCTQSSDCECRYKFWSDRRQQDRRAADVGIGSLFYNDSERRLQLERRLA